MARPHSLVTSVSGLAKPARAMSCAWEGFEPLEAIADARWTKEVWTFLAALNPHGAERRPKGRKHA